jgi:predicted nucleic-acid-binding protein
MKIIADTNILIRAITGDDPRQSAAAQAALSEAEVVALPLAALCELVWVLARGYKIPLPEIAEAIRRLTNGATVMVNHQAVAAGLAMLESGGDFADGIIAQEGRWLGADTFVSFDRRAVALIEAQGHQVHLLALSAIV